MPGGTTDEPLPRHRSIDGPGPAPADGLAAMRAFCAALVGDVARAAVHDAVLYKQATMRLDAFLGEQLREQQRRARPAADTLARIEQRDVTELHLSSLLAEQLEPTGATPAVRHFITTAWAKVLAQAMQEHGEKGQPTLAVLRTTDDLLWSLHPPDHPQGRKRLVAMLPGWRPLDTRAAAVAQRARRLLPVCGHRSIAHALAHARRAPAHGQCGLDHAARRRLARSARGRRPHAGARPARLIALTRKARLRSRARCAPAARG